MKAARPARVQQSPMAVRALLAAAALAALMVAGIEAAPARSASAAASALQDAPPAAALETPTRADLAYAYFHFEEALARANPGPERRLEIGLAFDEAGAAFLSGGAAVVYRRMVELTDSIVLDNPDDPSATAAGTVRASVEPPVLVRGSGDVPRVRLRRLFERQGEPAPVLVRVIDARGDADRPLASHRFNLAPCGPLPAEHAFGPADLSPGRYPVRIGPPDATAPLRTTAAWTIVAAPLDEVRERNAAAVDALDREGRLATPDLRRAAAAFRSRNALLTMRPSPHDSAQFLADLSVLDRALAGELRALSEGRNPYREHPGALWRTYTVAGTDVPVRLFNPPRLPDQPAGTPRPLVIALHGAGGDESMFPLGYGRGIITRLAEEHGFVLCVPRTGPFAANPVFFDDLVAGVCADYDIDPRRIYIVGHSMGGGVAGAWAMQRRDRIAAAACIAGFTAFSADQPVCPTLVVVPGRDRLVEPTRVIDAARAAAAAGAPIEPRFIPDGTHTLVVGDVLPEVIPWLLGHTLPDTPEPPAR